VATFDDFVPDPAFAKGDTAPEPWLCIAVSGTVVERRSFLDAVECPLDLYRKLLNDAPPTPDPKAQGVRNWRRVPDQFRALRASRCSACWFETGHQRCSVCGGSGRIQRGDSSIACPSCESGYRKCDSCAGSGQAVKLKVEYGEDLARPFAHIFVPDVPLSLHANLRRFIAAQPTIPDALAVNLDEDFSSADAYRGRGDREHYRGHAAGKALERAQQYLARITRLPTVVAERHAAHVWPFAAVPRAGQLVDGMLQSDYYVCLVCDASGTTHLLE
jgi:hypothetical protein